MKFYNCEGMLIRSDESGNYQIWTGERWSEFRDSSRIVSSSSRIGSEFALRLLQVIAFGTEYVRLSPEKAEQKLFEPETKSG